MPVVKRSYSRPISRSFFLSQSHSISDHKACVSRVIVEEAESAQNQIPPSALMQLILGCGFGCGLVAVLVTIREMSLSQMVTVAGKNYCMTSVGSYQLVSFNHLQ